jgi:hypothetical protein
VTDEYKPRRGFLLDRDRKRQAPPSPFLISLQQKQAGQAVDDRIIDTTFTREELQQLGSPVQSVAIVRGSLSLVRPVSNVIPLVRRGAK